MHFVPRRENERQSARNPGQQYYRSRRPDPTKGASSEQKGGANTSVASLSKGGLREAAVSEGATEHTHDVMQTAP
jgi:hypothetical protein